MLRIRFLILFLCGLVGFSVVLEYRASAETDPCSPRGLCVPVKPPESEVSADELAVPVFVQQADTENGTATLETAERRLKDPEVSKAWVEWSEKARELRREHIQAAGEAVALLPTTEEEFERIKNDPEWQRRRNEALHKTAEIHTRLKAHQKKNPLFQ